MATPVIIENDTGERLQLVDGRWAPLANSKAPGAGYLPDYSRGDPDKSEAAYYRDFKQKNDVEVQSAQKGIATARRMEGLLSRQKTGGIYGVPVVGGLAGWMDPEIREMESIQAESARNKRQPGEGAISDFDARQFMAMSYGKDKPTATNRAMIQAQRVADDAVLQRRAFSDWYVNSYGTTNGAPEAWARYSQDNPIFDARSETAGAPMLNSGRQQWREYFGAVRGEGDRRESQASTDARRAVARGPAPPPAKKPAGWSRSLPKAQRAAAMMYKGAKAPAGDKGNPYVPATAAEFNKLPPNVWVLDDDGTPFQKGKR